MFVPPLMTLLRGELTVSPVAFYQSTKTLAGDWSKSLGPSGLYVPSLDKTFVVWYTIGTSGYKGVQVAAYDHDSQSWSERYKVGNFLLVDDDHGGPAICQDAEGYFYVFYGNHASNQRWAISSLPNDITSWTNQAALGTNTTYPNPVLVGSTIYLFFRNDGTLSQRLMSLRTATPSSGSATFGSVANIVDFGSNSRSYIGGVVEVGTDIHIVATRANSGDTARKGVYYFIYDTTTGAMKNYNSSFSTASGSLPVDLTSADTNYRIYDHGSNQGDIPSLCFDTSGDAHIVFADGTGTTYNLLHMKLASGTWSSTATVDAITDEIGGAGYTTGYALIAGASNTVEAWYINSAGDKLRKVRSAGGTWGSAETILAAGAYNLRGQQSVKNASADFRSLFCETAEYPSSDASSITAKRYGYGDSGPITAQIPMASIDSLYSNVSLLLGFEQRDGSTIVVDESDSCFVATANGNAQVDTAQFKFGSSSLLLDGTGDYLTFPSNALFQVTNGDFTIECFVRRNASKLQCIASKRPNTGTSEWSCYINASNQLVFQGYSTSAAVVAITGTTALSSGVWYHVAFTRQGSTWRAFLDGGLEATGTESATPNSNSQVLHIGRDPSNTGRDFNGHIDEFRFTSGHARYTAAFTAPSAAFPRR